MVEKQKGGEKVTRTIQASTYRGGKDLGHPRVFWKHSSPTGNETTRRDATAHATDAVKTAMDGHRAESSAQGDLLVVLMSKGNPGDVMHARSNYPLPEPIGQHSYDTRMAFKIIPSSLLTHMETSLSLVTVLLTAIFTE